MRTINHVTPFFIPISGIAFAKWTVILCSDEQKKHTTVHRLMFPVSWDPRSYFCVKLMQFSLNKGTITGGKKKAQIYWRMQSSLFSFFVRLTAKPEHCSTWSPLREWSEPRIKRISRGSRGKMFRKISQCCHKFGLKKMGKFYTRWNLLTPPRRQNENWSSHFTVTHSTMYVTIHPSFSFWGRESIFFDPLHKV